MMNVAVIGAGPAGLMAADVLSQAGVAVDVYEAKPSVGRKFLMAGKGGLNITHSEPFDDFISRYDAVDWLAPMLREFDANDVRAWMTGLGVESFVGTSGRVFPTEMKAAPLLRHWLADLKKRGVRVHCRQYWRGFDEAGGLRFDAQTVQADATVLALGGGSWPSLGADGAWVPILAAHGVPLAPLLPSNCGFTVDWSPFMRECAGLPLKNIVGWCGAVRSSAEMVVTADGVEGGLVYALSRPLREQLLQEGAAVLNVDLYPDVAESELVRRLQPFGKLSTSNLWRKAGLDGVRVALLREALPKTDWADAVRVAACLKRYALVLNGMSPMVEAISTAGGVRREAVDARLMLHALPSVFCCGEMLDWDAPTGGYLLTACLASGQFAARGVLDWLKTSR
ncbi:MAG: TIGR03862 family flavoprotein [Formosimonas sp.]